MIEVPVRVKDALKSGDYRKNVKITVEGITNVGHTYTPPEITIKYGFDVWEDHIWFIDPGFSVELSDSSIFILRIDCTNIKEISIGDGNIYTPLNSPELFEVVGTETIFTIPDLAEGQYTINLSSYDEFTYIYCNRGNLVINNNNLVAESVKFDERMCSDSNLKFGLCEGTSVEFQYFDLPNIRGHHIIVSFEIEYKDENGVMSWYEIPMGQFDVDECSRQASTGIYKATAYNKLKSEYLDADAKSELEQMLIDDPDHSLSLRDILTNMLMDYSMLGEGWIQKDLKIYAEADVWTSNGNEQKEVWKKSGGSWVKCTTGSTFPTSACFTKYRATFYLLPSDASGTTTTGFFKYTINLPALCNYIKSYLCNILDLQNGSAVLFSIDGSAYGIDITPSGMLGPMIQTWSNYLGEGVGNFHYKPAGESDWSVKSIYSNAVSFTTEEISDYFPFVQIYFAVTGSDTKRVPGSTIYPDARIAEKITERFNGMKSALVQSGCISIMKKDMTPVEEKRLTLSEVDGLSDAVSLRDLQSAVFEINCQYGKLDRISDLFSGIELTDTELRPHDALYPADGLYPMGQAESGYPAMYSKLWADEGNVHKFRYLIITYKGTVVIDGQTQEVEKKLQRTVYADGTDDYNMSDNWLFRNLVWTDAQIGTYADAMVAKMRNISWFPFEMWCAGLPYIESGDAIEIQMKEATYKSYILRRTLSGIQNLQDEMINGTLDIF